MKKRILAFALVSVVLLMLCSCGKNSPVSVNGTKIGKGVYNYFMDRAKADNPDLSSSEQTEIAYTAISEYVAINSQFAEKKLLLSTSEKATLSNTVNSYWRLFSTYYDNINVTKQDLYEVEQSKLYREKLMLQYYSQDGESPVSDEQLRDYFSNNFIAFRAITGFLTTVDSSNSTVSLTDESRQAVIDTFKEMADNINGETTGLDEASTYADNVTVTSEIVVINHNTTDYPDGFYDNLANVETNKATSFVIGDYIFTAQRFDINSEELELFSTYKTDCLKSLKGDDFNKVVAAWSENYVVSK